MSKYAFYMPQTRCKLQTTRLQMLNRSVQHYPQLAEERIIDRIQYFTNRFLLTRSEAVIRPVGLCRRLVAGVRVTGAH